MISDCHLEGVHPDLLKVIAQARSAPAGVIFVVVQGTRTEEEEARMVAAGLSHTMCSRHLPGKDGLGHAVDLAVVGPTGQINWAAGHELEIYGALAEKIKAAAKAVGVPIIWGGDWHGWKDWDHFELPAASYP